MSHSLRREDIPGPAMLNLFSLKEEKKVEGTKGASKKKASAAQLRITKVGLLDYLHGPSLRL